MKYHVRFVGRQRGAIGITHHCARFVEADTPEAARLALYDTHEHILAATLTPLALRYVATYVNRDGTRTLMGAAQGRETFETSAEAQAWIDAVLANNAADTVRSIWNTPDPQFAVRACWCWPESLDPIWGWFDTEDSEHPPASITTP